MKHWWSRRGDELQTRSVSVIDVSVADIMTRNVIRVRPDTSVETLVKLLLDNGISGVPVVDEDDRPIGMVSKTDLVRRSYEGGDVSEAVRLVKMDGYTMDLGPGYHTQMVPAALVSEVMMAIAFTLPEDAPVSRAAALMVHEGVHRLVVVSKNGTLVGIVTTMNIMRWLTPQLIEPTGEAWLTSYSAKIRR